MRRAAVAGETVRLILLGPTSDEERADALVAVVQRNGGKLSVYCSNGSGWTMPIDANGRPPKGSNWAWRVHPDDLEKLR